jgi:hypothetical protein
MTPAALRLQLLRNLDEAMAQAYCAWPGEPPRWLVDVAAEVEIRLHEAERRLDRARPLPLPPAGPRHLSETTG